VPGREAALTVVPGKLYVLMIVPGIHAELSELPRKDDILGVSRKRCIFGEEGKHVALKAALDFP
jgi:hypothetical protein